MKCIHDGCDDVRIAQGLCSKHYTQYRKKGIIKKLPPFIPKECAVNNCRQKVMARGFCDKHYQRLRKRGDVSDPIRTPWPSNCAYPSCNQLVGVKIFGLCRKHYSQLRNGILGRAKEKESHGMNKSSEYHAWQHMKARCLDKSNQSYEDYGARGIKICERWRNSFKSFLEDIGLKPSPERSIDRINNDGNYSCGHCDECIRHSWPANCRWADDLTQRLNQRVRVNNKSGYKNISWDVSRLMWAVRIKRNKKYVFGGRFDSLKKAVSARNKFLLEYENGVKKP